MTLTERTGRAARSPEPFAIVCLASAAGLVIEIVAARILAPSIGVSIFTWTSIIGIVLAGISVGNYLGGRLADMCGSKTRLGLILLAGLPPALSSCRSPRSSQAGYRTCRYLPASSC